MVELHSWLTIKETYEICEDENEDRIIQNINHLIQELKYIEVSINVRNAHYYIEFSLYTNHFSADVQEYIDFFSEIGTIAKGSYGLLYLRNDEDAAHGNEFQILSLSRGKVKQYDDKMLSPFVPTVEDFDEELN